MRYNPCGQAVDWIKYPYTARLKPFRDSDQETVIRWVKADPKAPTLPFGSAICNLCLEVDKEWYDNPVGEIWEGGRRAVWTTRPPGLNGDHRCGTDADFQQGGLYQPTLPPVVYGSYGWPVCCAPVVRIRGGAGGAGRCVVSVLRPIRVYGGGGGGGRCVVFRYVVPLQGGIDFGGPQVGPLVKYTVRTVGGSETGGDLLTQVVFRVTSFGGYETGGSLFSHSTWTIGNIGGQVIGGQFVYTYLGVIHTYGGFEFGGPFFITYTIPIALHGGFEIGGPFKVAYSLPTALHGGFEFGGPFTYSYTIVGPSSVITTGTSSPMVVTLPSHSTGDNISVVLCDDSGNGPPAGPAWCVFRGGAVDGFSSEEIDVYAGAVPSGTTTASFSVSGVSHWRAIATNWGSNAYAAITAGAAGGAPPIHAPAISVPSGSHWIIACAATGSASSSATMAAPSPLTNLSSNGAYALAIGYEQVGGATFGPFTFTSSPAGFSWCAITFRMG